LFAQNTAPVPASAVGAAVKVISTLSVTGTQLPLPIVVGQARCQRHLRCGGQRSAMMDGEGACHRSLTTTSTGNASPTVRWDCCCTGLFPARRCDDGDVMASLTGCGRSGRVSVGRCTQATSAGLGMYVALSVLAFGEKVPPPPLHTPPPDGHRSVQVHRRTIGANGHIGSGAHHGCL
jgi:hypothetical protein